MKRMTQLYVPVAIGLLAPLGLVANAGVEMPTSNFSSQMLFSRDIDFLNKAAMGNLMEIKLGQYAMDHSSNDWVKAFGRRMVLDHSKAYDTIREVALSKGLAVPYAISDKAKDDYNQVIGQSGDAFDDAYIRMMVTDHAQDLKDYQDAANNCFDFDICGLAQSMVPVIQGHALQVDALAERRGIQGTGYSPNMGMSPPITTPAPSANPSNDSSLPASPNNTTPNTNSNTNPSTPPSDNAKPSDNNSNTPDNTPKTDTTPNENPTPNTNSSADDSSNTNPTPQDKP